MKIRLNSVGYLADGGEERSPAVYDRPVMMVYTGAFDSMDGEVTISEEHVHALARNHNSLLERVKRLATGEIPMRDCPPLQLDHSTSAAHTVGRLMGPLSVGTIDIDGSQRMALFGVARFLGEENVEKAKDGRYTHVSIGADLEAGVINELSVTPFPAAPKASLLSKRRLASHGGIEYQVVEIEPGEYDIYIAGAKVHHHAGSAAEVDAEARRYIEHDKGEKKMHEKLKKHLMEHRKMSEHEAEKLSKDCLAHHMKHMGMDEEKMGKHLAEAKDEELKRMSEEYDKHMKHLAEKGPAHNESDAPEKQLARRNDFVKLASGIRQGLTDFRLAARKSAVASRLSRFRSEAKVTPAELRKLDIARLAELDDTAMEAVLSTFDMREPVLRFGSLTGSNKAEAIEAISKKYRLARLELETRMNMPSKKAEAQKQMSALLDQERVELAAVGAPGEVDLPAKGMLTKLTYDDLCRMLDDKKQHEDLKRHLKHMMDHHGVEMPEHSEAHMSALAKRQSELQNNLEQLIALASPVLGIKPDEIK